MHADHSTVDRRPPEVLLVRAPAREAHAHQAPRTVPQRPVVSGWVADPSRAPLALAFAVGAWAVYASMLSAAVRWLEVSLAWGGLTVTPTSVADAVLSGVLVPAVLGVFGILAWGLIRRGGAHPGVALAAAGGAVTVMGVALSLGGAPGYLQAWRPEMASAIALDLGIIITAALATLALMVRTRGVLGIAVRVVASGAAAVSLLALVTSLAYVMGLRMPLSAPVLWHTWMHFGELRTVIASEADAAVWGVLALGTAVLVAPLVILAVLSLRQRPQESPSRLGVASALWTAVPLLGLLAVLPSPPAALGAGPLTRFVTPPGASGETADPDRIAELTFDARDARFVPIADSPVRNVIVLVLESHRRHSTTPYTPDLETTPFLNSLAQEGLLVEDMYAVVPHTNKSLVSIFGGVYPRLTPDYASNQPGGLPARGLPALLSDHGYASAFFTPATLAFERKDEILANLGFDRISGDGDYDTTGFATKNYFGHEDRILMDSTFAWIDAKVASGDPFALGMLTLTSHHPYTVPAGVPEYDFDPDAEVNDYLNALRYTDGVVREFWGGIQERGLDASTLLVVVGDHGEAFGEHGAISHSDVIWDEALAIPAVIVGPGIAPGRVSGPRSTIDILPTIAEAMGYRIGGTRGLQGLSLLHPVAPDRTLHHAARAATSALAVRRGSRKISFWASRPPHIFNTLTDPRELNDLASGASPEAAAQDPSPEITAEIDAARTEAHAWRAAVAASYAAQAVRSRSHPDG